MEKFSSSSTLDSCNVSLHLFRGTHAKVGEHELRVFGLRLEQNVLRFQVTVDDTLVVKVFDGIHDSANNVGSIPTVSAVIFHGKTYFS